MADQSEGFLAVRSLEGAVERWDERGAVRTEELPRSEDVGCREVAVKEGAELPARKRSAGETFLRALGSGW